MDLFLQAGMHHGRKAVLDHLFLLAIFRTVCLAAPPPFDPAGGNIE